MQAAAGGGELAGRLRCTCAQPLPIPSCPQKLAVFTVESKWAPNKPLEAKNCYGTTTIEHPAVQVRFAFAFGFGVLVCCVCVV